MGGSCAWLLRRVVGLSIFSARQYLHVSLHNYRTDRFTPSTLMVKFGSTEVTITLLVVNGVVCKCGAHTRGVVGWSGRWDEATLEV